MKHRIETFADIIHPVSEEEFFAEYYDKKPLLVRAPDPDKFAEVMSWEILSDLLNMTAIWCEHSLQMVLDRNPVPAAQYCREAINRSAKPGLQPDAERVKDWLQRGASLVVNDIDTLTSPMAAVADALEGRFNAKAQSNLYCSWQQHQAFDTHMDTHDVFALHVAGEKSWRIYEGQLDNAVAHDMFRNQTQEFHNEHAGKVLLEPTLRPGDFLYIPRGQYHDALASSTACIHLTFGMTRVIGYDLLSLLFNNAMANTNFRANFPLITGDDNVDREAVRTHIAGLAGKLEELARADAVTDDMLAYIKSFHYFRGGFDLPNDATVGGDMASYGLTSPDFVVVRANGRAALKGKRGVIPIPEGLDGVVSWVVEHPRFTRAELSGAFPDLPDAGREKLLADLSSMKVIAPA